MSFSSAVADRTPGRKTLRKVATITGTYSSGLGDLEIHGQSIQFGGMNHVDMRKLPAAAQEERRRQVVGLREGGLTYDAIAAQDGLVVDGGMIHLNAPSRPSSPRDCAG
jgi:hypothetical protein